MTRQIKDVKSGLTGERKLSDVSQAAAQARVERRAQYLRRIAIIAESHQRAISSLSFKIREDSIDG